MTQIKEWFEDLVLPTTPTHLKQWANKGLSLQEKTHNFTQRGFRVELAKNRTFVKKEN